MSKYNLIFAIKCFAVFYCLTFYQVTDATEKKSAFDLRKYINANEESQLTNFWNSIGAIYGKQDAVWEEVADNVSRSISEMNVGEEDVECYRAIEETFRRGIQSEWSAKLINSNSFAKRNFISGIVTEEFTNLGDFDDCLSVVAHNESTTTHQHTLTFQGKYCLASIRTPQLGYYHSDVENEVLANISAKNYFEGLAKNWLRVRNRFPYAQGICVPSVCSEEQMEKLIYKYFEKYLNGMKVTVGFCQESGKGFEMKPGFFIALHIIFLAVTLAVIGTLLNLKYFRSLTDSPPALKTMKHYFGYFDMVRNFSSLFEAKHQDKNNKYDLRFIHGLKGLLIAIMCIGHSFCYLTVAMLYQISTFRKFPSNVILFLNNPILRDFWEKIVMMISMFFIISGFLTTYITLMKIKRAPRFVPYVFLRWLFLIPSVIGTLCLTIIFQYLGSGPLFHPKLTDPYVEPCHNYWWTHVLFINNFWSGEKMCGISLWFIAVSFQLHIALYVVIFLYFHRKVYSFLSATLLSCVSFFMLVIFYFNIVGVPLAKSVVRFQFEFPIGALGVTYMSTILHTMPYFFGALCALFLLNYTFTKISAMQNVIYTIFWGIFVLLAAAIQFPAAWETEDNEQPKFLFNLATFVIFATIVSLNISWFMCMILSSVTSIIKKFLSLNMWLPFSRLSYGIYLLNPLLIWYNVHLNRDTPTLSIISSTTFSISIYLQSLALAVILFLIFEAPFGALITDLTRGYSPPKNIDEQIKDLQMTNNNNNDLEKKDNIA